MEICSSNKALYEKVQLVVNEKDIIAPTGYAECYGFITNKPVKYIDSIKTLLENSSHRSKVEMDAERKIKCKRLNINYKNCSLFIVFCL